MIYSATISGHEAAGSGRFSCKEDIARLESEVLHQDGSAGRPERGNATHNCSQRRTGRSGPKFH